MNAGANGEQEKSVLPEAAMPLLSSPSEPLDARQVITRFRLDIVLKYLFFRSLDGAADRAHWELFYRKHILDRTRGVEPRDRFQKKPSNKQSVDDYVTACEDLYRSFKSDGFDPTYPIPVSADKRLLNGAHRTACALATDTRVVVAPAKRGAVKSWGFRWFLERGYPRDVLAALLYHYAHLTTRGIGVMILWGPVLQVWREIMAELKNEVGEVGWLDLSFEANPSAFESIVQDIYALQWSDLDQSHIRRKTIFLNQSRRIFRVLVLEDLFEHRPGFLKNLGALRARIRAKFNDLIPEEAFCTCHASSNESESAYLIELLLGQGSRKHQLIRPRGQLRPEFGGWLYKLEEELALHGLSRQDVCIVGSSPLEVLGIRNATDIDITVSSRFRKRFGAGITHLNQWLDVVTQEYARASDRPTIPDDQLIENPQHHFWFRGFKFADVDIVLRRKALQGRAKDVADVEAAKSFFSPEAGKRLQANGANRAGIELISYLVRREKDHRGRRL